MRQIASFASETEARALQAALASQGIESALTNAEVVANFWQYSNAVGGVGVEVAEQDWDAAQAMLKSDASQLAPWVCETCGTEIEAGFDTCWKCARVVEPGPHDDFDPDGDDASQVTSQSDFDDDFIDKPEPTDTSKVLERAWKASIIGFMVPLGLLNLYSFYLLFIHVPTENLTAAELRRFVAACVANSLALSFAMGLFFWFL